MRRILAAIAAVGVLAFCILAYNAKIESQGSRHEVLFRIGDNFVAVGVNGLRPYVAS